MNEINEIAIKCFKEEAQAILDLIPRLSEDFSKAVELIIHSKGKLIVTGVGKSGHVGKKIAATLASLGTPSFFLNPLDAYHGDLGMVSSGDIVMAISYSGNTDELLRFIPYLLERNIPIIGITGNPESLLAKCSVCHLNIKVKHEADPLNLAPTSSTATTMAMGDALACAIVKQNHFKASDFARFHPGGNLGRKLLVKVKDVMKSKNMPVLHSDMSITEALVIISEGKLGMAIVLTGNEVDGLVTSGDVRRVFENNGPESFNMIVGDFMNNNPKCIYEDMSLSTAEDIFKKQNVQTLVVLNRNNKFVGFLDYANCSI